MSLSYDSFSRLTGGMLKGKTQKMLVGIIIGTVFVCGVYHGFHEKQNTIIASNVASTEPMSEMSKDVANATSEYQESVIEPQIAQKAMVDSNDTTGNSANMPNADVVVEEDADFYSYAGERLDSVNGQVEGPSGKETYYNLDMDGVVAIMQDLGYNYQYSVREDGVKTYGGYVMVAANLDIRPKGTIVETSLGTGMVVDTGSFAESNPTQLDIATTW